MSATPAPVGAAGAARGTLLERAAMGLLDYYRQFEGMSEEEVNAGMRAEAAERRAQGARAGGAARPLADHVAGAAATRGSSTPSPIVARRGLHRYPQVRAPELRSELAERHGSSRRQILGTGAAELLAPPSARCSRPVSELVIPWP